MKRFLDTLILLLFSVLSISAASQADNAISFLPESPLSSGKWVKIEIEKTGMYEISYDVLREMGFENPERVGVYGRGGAMYDSNFTTSKGVPIYKDGLAEVSVLHLGKKLYFYGVGTMQAELKLTSSASNIAGGYFSRKSKNIYCDKGYYFLSDIDGPKEMQTSDISDLKSADELTHGISFAYHEKDIYQNNSNTGQLFYGEKFSPARSRLSFPVSLTGAVPDSKGVMVCHFYADRNADSALLTYGLEGAEGIASVPVSHGSSTDFTPQTPLLNYVDVPSAKGKVFVNFESDEELSVSNLDYWMLTYERGLPSLVDADGRLMSQDFIAFPTVGILRTAKLRIAGGSSYIAVNVADPYDPICLEMVHDGGDGIAYVKRQVNDIPQVVVFNPLKTQLQISGYDAECVAMGSQTLHSLASNGADLVIICIPDLRESAERLANLHREKDGMRVIVATTEECYNEFSSGLPDPMAYRAFVKMAYETKYSCRNLLLMGPLFADFRGIVNEKHPFEGIIAYQNERTNVERWAFNVNDFYGILADYIVPSAIEKEVMQVGVGILPVRYPAQAEMLIDKIEGYMAEEDKVYYLDSFINIGGVGDNHTHDRQALDLSNYISTINYGSTVFTPIVVDAYGFEAAHKKLFSSLGEGAAVAYYFGHGSPGQLNRYGNFFDKADVMRLRNRVLPFVCFAGCKLSIPDVGEIGLGESIVTSTPYGAIGALLSTRETYSSPNMNFMENFFLSMYSEPYCEKTMTVGEMFAKAKSRSVLNNELAFQLVCDPAIVLPTVSRPISFDNMSGEAYPGEFMDVSGCVLNADGECDTSFNGTAVIKILEPYRLVRSADLCSSDKYESMETEHDLDIIYCDTQLAVGSARVTNGKFHTKVMIPTKAKMFKGQIGRIHVAAYSTSAKIGAGVMGSVNFENVSGKPTTLDKDLTPPAIELFEYDSENNILNLRASDNIAMAYETESFTTSTRLYLDGREHASGSRSRKQPIVGRNAYTMRMPVDGLSEGKHTARIEVSDAAGNKASSEITFDTSVKASAYILSLKGGVVENAGVFEILGEKPGISEIIILDAEGNTVRRAPFGSSGFVWDRCDGIGRRVSPGVYKAYIIERGGKLRKSQSKVIDVPVI